MRSAISLGLDIGSSRVRLALVERVAGKPRLHAVAARDLPADVATHGEVVRPELVAASIEEMLAELNTDERRCVCGIGTPSASLRSLRLPTMTSLERTQMARLDVERQLGRKIDDVVVRIHPVPERAGTYQVGAVARRALATRVAAARRAGLRVIAVDHEAMALRRCLPFADAIVDIGQDRTTCYAFSESECSMTWTGTGGASVTHTIGRDLQLEFHTAERRKRIVGTAGAGERAISDLIREIAHMFEASKKMQRGAGTMCVVGNGSRVNGLEDRLRDRLGIAYRPNAAAVELGDRVPADVSHRAMADWSLAIGLALWSRT